MAQATQQPVLSIITVSAFDSKRLKSTLESLTQVADFTLEHITVLPRNDYESMAVWNDLCLGYSNFFVIYDENQGIYPAMNMGAATASGEFLAFWNSGERITNEAEVGALLSSLNSSKSSQVISQGKVEWLPEHKQDIHEYFGFLRGEENRFISHQTFFVRRKLFSDLGGFSHKYKVVSDTDFILKSSEHDLEILDNCTPVFVENSLFASNNHRKARIENLSMSIKHGWAKQDLSRIKNLLKHELGGLKDKYFDALEVSSWAIGGQPFRRKGKTEPNIEVNNFGRTFIANQFVRVYKEFSAGIKVERIAIVGGSRLDPEAIWLASEYPNAEFIIVGIEAAQYYLDLNQRNSEAIPVSNVVLVSQVIEHVWNHQNFFDNVISLTSENGIIWVGCPASNKVHGSPDFYSAGFTAAFLSQNFVLGGVQSCASGGFGTKRLYWATHLLPGWFSRRAHTFPQLFAFDDRRLALRWFLRIRFAPILFLLNFVSPLKTENERWFTESWWMGQKKENLY